MEMSLRGCNNMTKIQFQTFTQRVSLFLCISSRLSHWIPPLLHSYLSPLPLRLTTRPGTVSGPAPALRLPRAACLVSASSWMAVTAVGPAPSRWARSATRRTTATTTVASTVTTAQTSLGTKKECVHVSVPCTKHVLVLRLPLSALTLDSSQGLDWD